MYLPTRKRRSDPCDVSHQQRHGQSRAFQTVCGLLMDSSLAVIFEDLLSGISATKF
jgi:hypothetical protein